MAKKFGAEEFYGASDYGDPTTSAFGGSEEAYKYAHGNVDKAQNINQDLLAKVAESKVAREKGIADAWSNTIQNLPGAYQQGKKWADDSEIRQQQMRQNEQQMLQAKQNMEKGAEELSQLRAQTPWVGKQAEANVGSTTASTDYNKAMAEKTRQMFGLDKESMQADIMARKAQAAGVYQNIAESRFGMQQKETDARVNALAAQIQNAAQTVPTAAQRDNQIAQLTSAGRVMEANQLRSQPLPTREDSMQARAQELIKQGMDPGLVNRAMTQARSGALTERAQKGLDPDYAKAQHTKDAVQKSVSTIKYLESQMAEAKRNNKYVNTPEFQQSVDNAAQMLENLGENTLAQDLKRSWAEGLMTPGSSASKLERLKRATDTLKQRTAQQIRSEVDINKDNPHLANELTPLIQTLNTPVSSGAEANGIFGNLGGGGTAAPMPATFAPGQAAQPPVNLGAMPGARRKPQPTGGR